MTSTSLLDEAEETLVTEPRAETTDLDLVGISALALNRCANVQVVATIPVTTTMVRIDPTRFLKLLLIFSSFFGFQKTRLYLSLIL
jgi:hypothetical protein